MGVVAVRVLQHLRGVKVIYRTRGLCYLATSGTVLVPGSGRTLFTGLFAHTFHGLHRVSLLLSTWSHSVFATPNRCLFAYRFPTRNQLTYYVISPPTK